MLSITSSQECSIVQLVIHIVEFISLESDVRISYWPPYIECQVSSLESDVRCTYWST